MSTSSATARLLRHSLTRTARQLVSRRQISAIRPHTSRVVPIAGFDIPSRCFNTNVTARYPGLMPDSENPQPPQNEPDTKPKTATAIEDEDYHTHSEEMMDKIHEKAEEVVEQRDDVEVEYAAGVLSIKFPPNGEYIINKQPPNKQIWLSSPISGPKRFDWYVEGESMHQKEGGGMGEWVYLRDGTSLSELLRKELGIDVTVEGIEEELKKRSVDPVE